MKGYTLQDVSRMTYAELGAIEDPMTLMSTGRSGRALGTSRILPNAAMFLPMRGKRLLSLSSRTTPNVSTS